MILIDLIEFQSANDFTKSINKSHSHTQNQRYLVSYNCCSFFFFCLLVSLNQFVFFFIFQLYLNQLDSRELVAHFRSIAYGRETHSHGTIVSPLKKAYRLLPCCWRWFIIFCSQLKSATIIFCSLSLSRSRSVFVYCVGFVLSMISCAPRLLRSAAFFRSWWRVNVIIFFVMHNEFTQTRAHTQKPP